ncbi:cysteine-rich secretory protein 2-like [Saccostrea echinata]|uniref:cysteine-rich secretory protein 2-like n=1 Tax=Saccostrea echinata TaxID=191078 RepID=UPI002A834A01|nr:cysteine-rich secretory protein 2-like [Saccostrea echinata]
MIQLRIYFILFFNILEVTQLRASRLRIRQIEEILQEHNRHRRNLAMGLYGTRVSNMRKLTWSKSLQRHTSEILQCSSENSDLFQNSLTVNIGKGASLSGIIHEWFREIQHLFPYEASCLESSPCSNILTMINAGHHSIGCSFKRCSGKIKLLCMYEGGAEYPPVYKPGTPCTKCDDDAAFCDDGLCVACNSTIERCDCRKTCSKPLIGQGTLDNSTCTCTCRYGLGPNCDEECKNQNMYENWDICQEVTDAECNSPYPEEREMFKEFCPLKCGACNIFPYSQILSTFMRRSRGK